MDYLEKYLTKERAGQDLRGAVRVAAIAAQRPAHDLSHELAYIAAWPSVHGLKDMERELECLTARLEDVRAAVAELKAWEKEHFPETWAALHASDEPEPELAPAPEHTEVLGFDAVVPAEPRFSAVGDERVSDEGYSCPELT